MVTRIHSTQHLLDTSDLDPLCMAAPAGSTRNVRNSPETKLVEEIQQI